ncbi:MAG: hypothetical protein VKP62_16245 [Candidatus Sericytochromatia bacterium]|nr:hypothetical protein [Candidatus Sericytochromatia bacterium]
MALLLFTTTLQGCATWSGYRELPARRAWAFPSLPARVWQNAFVRCRVAPGGFAPYLPTAWHPWGTISRAVIPYGDDVWQFSLAVEPLTGERVLVQPEGAHLLVDGIVDRRALSLTDYRRRWPLWALADEQQAADRAVAYRHLLDTLWFERAIPPGESHEAQLAFVSAACAVNLELRLPLRLGDKLESARFEWTMP